MGKKKSAVFLVLISIVIAALCFVCTVSFHYGTDNMNTFNSVISMIGKDAELGATLPDGQNYLGGSYAAVYYPEGVLSAREYEEDLAALDGAERDAYAERYVRYPDANGAVYLEKETVCGEDGAPTEAFRTSFAATTEVVRDRLSRLSENVRLDVKDGFTLRVELPAEMGQQTTVFNYFAYMGELSVKYGTSEDSATAFSFRHDETIKDYVKGAHAATAAGGTSYVQIDFTKKGREAVRSWTADAAESSATMYFLVGDAHVIEMGVNAAIDEGSLYINNTSNPFSAAAAAAIAATIDTALDYGDTGIALTVGDAVRLDAAFGDLALTLLYVAFGVCFAGMMIFFFVRYGLLGFAHLYTYLLYLFALILCIWAIPMLYLSVSTFLAVLFGSLLLSVADAMAYESARRDYDLGKTMVSSVKAGYKRCFLPVLDTHIVLALFGVLLFAVSLTTLSVFALTFTLAVAFSGLCSLAVNRFMWAVLMSLSRNKGAFCKFKGKEDDDDE